MNPIKVHILGMPLDEWRFRSCIAHFATGKDWASLYDIQSVKEGKGHASFILKNAKKYYEAQGLKVMGSVPLNARMESLYKKFGYEY